jgi:N-acetylmuramoyl-L-alanine amidase
MRKLKPGKEAGGAPWLRAWAALAAVGILLGCGAARAASPVVVREVRYWTAPDHTRVVLDLSGKAAYEIRRVGNPDRIAVTVAGARFAGTAPLTVSDGLLQGIRRNPLRGRAQVVLDLGQGARFRHFALPAQGGRPHRIVVDVFRPAIAVAPPAPPGAGATAVPALAAEAGPAAGEGASPPEGRLEAPDRPSGVPADVQGDAPSGARAGVAADAKMEESARGTAEGTAEGIGEGTADEAAGTTPAAVAAAESTNGVVAEPRPAPPRPFVVVIDPGHGGMDPGAIRSGLQEKDLTLDIARELARQIEAVPGYRAVLTRGGDYFVSLAERVRIAQKAQGDIFVSIHCNTNRRLAMDGMEVYFLSLQGATDREAQELADAENAADLVGLAPDEAGDDSVLSILMDLRMTRVLDQSSRLAEEILAAARRSPVVAARKVKQARFQVLRSLAMPSALVEMAFLSNERDRRLLATAAGRRQLAGLVREGLFSYRGHGETQLAGAVAAPRQRSAPAASGASWSRKYKVRRGDSLWRLAERHGTTMEEIVRQNQLRSRELRVGQRLRLPGGD